MVIYVRTICGALVQIQYDEENPDENISFVIHSARMSLP